MPDTSTTDALVGIDLERLSAGMVSDVLDGLGAPGHVPMGDWHVNCPQAVIFGPVRTLTLIAAPAHPLIAAPAHHPWHPDQAAAFFDTLQAGQVIVVDGFMDWAFWGELSSAFAIKRGVAGTIVRGLSRDNDRVQGLGYPVWSWGWCPRDIAGRGVVFGVDTALLDGTALGDWAFAAPDGVVIIPERLVERACEGLRQLVTKENAALARIWAGATMRELQAEGFAL